MNKKQNYGLRGSRVFVYNNNVEEALGLMNRILKKEDFKERLREIQYFIPNNQKRHRRSKKSIKQFKRKHGPRISHPKKWKNRDE